MKAKQNAKKVEKVKSEEFFGGDAGKIWRILNEKDEALTPMQLIKLSGLRASDVFGALGWLGREGKIEIICDDKSIKFKLIR